MRNTFFLLLISASFLSHGQKWVEPFLATEVQLVDFIDLNNLDEHQLFVSTGYGFSSLRNPEVLDRIGEGRVTQVDLIYSDFQRAKNFDQSGLNAKRARNLYTFLPALFDDPLIEWSLVG